MKNKPLDYVNKVLYPIDEKIITNLPLSKRTVLPYFDVMKVESAFAGFINDIQTSEQEQLSGQDVELIENLIEFWFPIFKDKLGVNEK